jgi:hypothetical protein
MAKFANTNLVPEDASRLSSLIVETAFFREVAQQVGTHLDDLGALPTGEQLLQTLQLEL